MDYVNLNNGLRIPNAGFGAWQLNDADCRNCIIEAIKIGYRLIDTAQSYYNEADVGYAINYCINAGLVKREELFIVSKINPHYPIGYDEAKKAVNSSLRKMGLDYIDCYLIHYPNLVEDDGWKRLNAQTWRAFEEFVDEGKLKSLGVSNFMEHHIDELLKTAKIKPVINQINLSPEWQQKGLVNYCREKDIALVAWSPVCRLEDWNTPVLEKVAKNYNKSIVQICLRYSLQKGFIPLSKSSHKERIKENFDIFNFNISNEDMDLLDTLQCYPAQKHATPDSIRFIWELAARGRDKFIAEKIYWKFLGHFNILKATVSSDGKKTRYYLFDLIPVAKKVQVNENKAKIYILGLKLFDERAIKKFIKGRSLVPDYSCEEKEYEFCKKSFKQKYKLNIIDRIINSANYFGDTYQNEKDFAKKLYRRFLFKRKISIPSLDVHITTNCTLKCKNCSHSIPYYKKEDRYNMSFDEFKNYLDKILKNVDKIYNLLILGGEPLLNKDLSKIIEYADKKSQILNIRILTNGTINPSSGLIISLKNLKKTSVMISNYSANKALKGYKLDEISKILNDNKIKTFVSDVSLWRKQPDINIDGAGISDAKTRWQCLKCNFRHIHLLSADGCVYPCAQAKHIRNLGYNIKNEDYIDLNKSKNLRKDFINFYTADYYKICACCDMTFYYDAILPALQLEET